MTMTGLLLTLFFAFVVIITLYGATLPRFLIERTGSGRYRLSYWHNGRFVVSAHPPDSIYKLMEYARSLSQHPDTSFYLIEEYSDYIIRGEQIRPVRCLIHRPCRTIETDNTRIYRCKCGKNITTEPLKGAVQ